MTTVLDRAIRTAALAKELEQSAPTRYRRKSPVSPAVPKSVITALTSGLPFVHETNLVKVIKAAQSKKTPFECETLLTKIGARALLDAFNNHNSPVSARKIKDYTKMLLDDYSDNGGSDCGTTYMKFDFFQGISFQHRNLSILSAAKINPLVNMRVRIRVGMAYKEPVRTDDKPLKEHLKRMGVPHADSISAALTFLGNFYKTGVVSPYQKRANTETALLDLERHYPDLSDLGGMIEDMRGKLIRKQKIIIDMDGLGVSYAAAGAFLYAACKVDKKVAFEFVETLLGRCGNKKNRDAWVEFYKTTFPQGVPARYDEHNRAFMALCYAWNAYVRGETITHRVLGESLVDFRNKIPFPELLKPSAATIKPRARRK